MRHFPDSHLAAQYRGSHRHPFDRATVSFRVKERAAPMRQVELQLTGWKIADAMAELRIWLDHNDCVPLNFEIRRLPNGALRVQIEFDDDATAEAFEREFAR
jgi:hypothetical protein